MPERAALPRLRLGLIVLLQCPEVTSMEHQAAIFKQRSFRLPPGKGDPRATRPQALRDQRFQKNTTGASDQLGATGASGLTLGGPHRARLTDLKGPRRNSPGETGLRDPQGPISSPDHGHSKRSTQALLEAKATGRPQECLCLPDLRASAPGSYPACQTSSQDPRDHRGTGTSGQHQACTGPPETTSTTGPISRPGQ